jgi:hypothetical protein
MVEVVFGSVVAVVAVLGYIERRALKAELVAVESEAALKVSSLEAALRASAIAEAGFVKTDSIMTVDKLNETLKGYGSQVRAKISADISKVIADAQAEAGKLTSDMKGDALTVIARIEVGIRKVL